MKYSWEFKLECINKYKNGQRINFPGTSKQHRNFMKHVKVWAKIYEDLGVEGLKHSKTNKKWTHEQRFELVSKALSGDSISSVAKNAHINIGQLSQWIRKYEQKGIDGLKCKKGRPIMKKINKTKSSISQQEELKILKERNEYLEMENEYLKKLNALVLKRKATETKAKKQK